MKPETLNMRAGILRSGLLFVSGLRHAAVLTRMRMCMCGKSRLRTEGVRGQGAALRECFQVARLQLAVLAQRILQHACSMPPPLLYLHVCARMRCPSTASHMQANHTTLSTADLCTPAAVHNRKWSGGLACGLQHGRQAVLD